MALAVAEADVEEEPLDPELTVPDVAALGDETAPLQRKEVDLTMLFWTGQVKLLLVV